MLRARTLLLGACMAALPLSVAARAAEPQAPSTVLLVVLPGPDAPLPAFSDGGGFVPMPAGFPVAQMLAEQNAMMQDMMRDLQMLSAQPWPSPDRIVQAALGDAGALPAAVCSETVTYVDPGNGAPPKLTVHRAGNGCGPAGSGAASVSQPLPERLAPREIAPEGIAPEQPAPFHPDSPMRVLRVKYEQPAHQRALRG